MYCENTAPDKCSAGAGENYCLTAGSVIIG